MNTKITAKPGPKARKPASKQLSLWIDESVVERLWALTESKGMSLTRLAEEIFRAHLDCIDEMDRRASDR